MISQIKTNINILNSLNSLLNYNINVSKKLHSPIENLFHQIIISPSELNLGNLSGDKIEKITLWNNTSYRAELFNINGINVEGLILTGLQSGILYPNSSVEYILEIPKSGESVIDSIFEFNFLNSDHNVSLSVTGSRLVLFDFDINWKTSNPPKEYYSHNTDIAISYSGKEQRVNISENPRFKFEYFYTLFDQERIEAENLIYSLGDQKIQVPIYFQRSYLTEDIEIGDKEIKIDNSYNIIQEGTSILIKDNNNKSVLKVKSIINDIIEIEDNLIYSFKKDSVVIPLINCYLNNNIAFNYINNNIAEFLLTFDVEDSDFNNINNNIDNFEQYNGLKLITRKPTRDIKFTKTFERQFEDMDYGYGIRKRIEKDKTPAILFNYKFSLFGKKEISEMKALFNNLKGRFNEFYIDSLSNDLILNSDITAEQLSLVIEDNGQISNNENIIKKIIRIELNNGEVYIREILNYSKTLNDKISILINNSLGVDISKNDIANIQYLSNARFNNDTLNIEHITDDYAEVSIDIRILRNI